jgi:hypothetical protein
LLFKELLKRREELLNDLLKGEKKKTPESKPAPGTPGPQSMRIDCDTNGAKRDVSWRDVPRVENGAPVVMSRSAPRKSSASLCRTRPETEVQPMIESGLVLS